MQKVALRFLVLYLQTLYRSLIQPSSKMALMNRYAFKEISSDFMLLLLKLAPFGSDFIFVKNLSLCPTAPPIAWADMGDFSFKKSKKLSFSLRRTCPGKCALNRGMLKQS